MTEKVIFINPDVSIYNKMKHDEVDAKLNLVEQKLSEIELILQIYSDLEDLYNEDQKK